MNIREDSKKILQAILDNVIEIGDMSEPFFINYEDLAKTLELPNEGYCRICCQYLNQIGCLHIIKRDQNDNRLIELMAKGIDFLEDN